MVSILHFCCKKLSNIWLFCFAGAITHKLVQMYVKILIKLAFIQIEY